MLLRKFQPLDVISSVARNFAAKGKISPVGWDNAVLT